MNDDMQEMKSASQPPRKRVRATKSLFIHSLLPVIKLLLNKFLLWITCLALVTLLIQQVIEGRNTSESVYTARAAGSWGGFNWMSICV